MAARKKKSARKPVRKKQPAARRPKRRQPETLRLRNAAPSLTVSDISKSVTFYRDVLGFTPGESYSEGGRLVGVELKAGKVSVWLSQDDWARGRDRVKGVGCRTHFTTVQDIDALAERIKARGGSLLHEPQDQGWGVRDIGVKDPDGYAFTIQTPLKKRR